MGLTNLPFCFNAFVEKPPFVDMVESNGVEGMQNVRKIGKLCI